MKHGIIIGTSTYDKNYYPIDVKFTKLINSTCEEFFEFANRKISSNIWLDKNKLFRFFILEYPRFKNIITQRKFTYWLRSWGIYKNLIVTENHSGYYRKVIFTGEEEKLKDILQDEKLTASQIYNKKIASLSDDYVKTLIFNQVGRQLNISCKEASKIYKPTKLEIHATRNRIIAKRAKRAVKKEIEEQATKKIVEKIHQCPEEIIYRNFNIKNHNNENAEKENRITEIGNYRGEHFRDGKPCFRFVSESQWRTNFSQCFNSILQYNYASDSI